MSSSTHFHKPKQRWEKSLLQMCPKLSLTFFGPSSLPCSSTYVQLGFALIEYFYRIYIFTQHVYQRFLLLIWPGLCDYFSLYLVSIFVSHWKRVIFLLFFHSVNISHHCAYHTSICYLFWLTINCEFCTVGTKPYLALYFQHLHGTLQVTGIQLTFDKNLRY